jgi:hypothetical protein
MRERDAKSDVSPLWSSTKSSFIQPSFAQEMAEVRFVEFRLAAQSLALSTLIISKRLSMRLTTQNDAAAASSTTNTLTQ